MAWLLGGVGLWWGAPLRPRPRPRTVVAVGCRILLGDCCIIDQERWLLQWQLERRTQVFHCCCAVPEGRAQPLEYRREERAVAVGCWGGVSEESRLTTVSVAVQARDAVSGLPY